MNYLSARKVIVVNNSELNEVVDILGTEVTRLPELYDLASGLPPPRPKLSVRKQDAS